MIYFHYLNLHVIILHFLYVSLDKTTFLLHDHLVVMCVDHLPVNIAHMYYENTMSTLLVTYFTVHSNHMYLFYQFEATKQWTEMHLPKLRRLKKGKFWKFSDHP